VSALDSCNDSRGSAGGQETARDRAELSTEMPPSRMNRKRWWIIVLAAVAVLAGLGLLAAWYYSDLLLRYD
jgi:ferric-dicitrate binding protein FerR (iron transport regulator)